MTTKSVVEPSVEGGVGVEDGGMVATRVCANMRWSQRESVAKREVIWDLVASDDNGGVVRRGIGGLRGLFSGGGGVGGEKHGVS